MTGLKPHVQSRLLLKLFGALVLAIGLTRLVSGYRTGDLVELVVGVLALGIAIFVGVRLLRSDEARKAPRPARKRRAQRDLLALYGEPIDVLPIPSLQRGVGTRLAVRLGPRRNTAFGVIVLTAAAVLGNGLLWPATCAAAEKGSPSLGFLLMPAVLSSFLALVAIATVSGWIGARKAPSVEISREPVAPGETFELSLSQPGPARIVSYEVRLVCIESVRRSGKPSKTYEHVASDTIVFKESAFMVGAGEPWTINRTVTVPEQAMHSFEAPMNEIFWRLVVEAVIDGWPDFKEFYPLRVLPKPPGGAA